MPKTTVTEAYLAPTSVACGTPIASVVNTPASTKSTEVKNLTFKSGGDEPFVVNQHMCKLVKGLDDFMSDCANSDDKNVADKLPDVQNHLLSYIAQITDQKFGNWKNLSDACKTVAIGEGIEMTADACR